MSRYVVQKVDARRPWLVIESSLPFADKAAADARLREIVAVANLSVYKIRIVDAKASRPSSAGGEFR